MSHILESLVERALDGDWRALQEVVSLMERYDTTPEPYSAPPSDDHCFHEALKRFERYTDIAKEFTEKDSEVEQDNLDH